MVDKRLRVHERAIFLVWFAVALAAVGVLPYIVGQEAPGHGLWNWRNGWDLVTFAIWVPAAGALLWGIGIYARHGWRTWREGGPTPW